MSEWTWMILSDSDEVPMCTRMAMEESNGWRVVSICRTSYESPTAYFQVFMRREKTP